MEKFSPNINNKKKNLCRKIAQNIFQLMFFLFLLLLFLLNFVRKITICTIMTIYCTCVGKESVKKQRKSKSKKQGMQLQLEPSCSLSWHVILLLLWPGAVAKCSCCPLEKHEKTSFPSPLYTEPFRLRSVAVLKHFPNILAHISIELSVNY